MYGQLSYRVDQPDQPWSVHCFSWLDLEPPALSPAVAAQRGVVLGQLRKSEGPLSEAQTQALMRVARALPLDTENLLGDLYLALAHWRLPDARRLAREQRVNATLQRYDDGRPWPEIAARIDFIRCLAPLLPDPLLEVHVASQIARLQMAAMMEPASARRCAPFLEVVQAVTVSLGFAADSPEKQAVLAAVFTRPLARRMAFLNALIEMTRRGLGAAVPQAVAAFKPLGLPPVVQGDLIEAVLRDLLALDPQSDATADMASLVTARVAHAQVEHAARTQAVIDLTLDALQAGVDMGPVIGPKNATARALADVVYWQAQMRMTPQRLRLLRQLQARRAARADPPAAEAVADPPDIDPVHTWSIKRLVQWIGGLVADSAPHRLDRRVIAAREHTLRTEARRRDRESAAPSSRTPPPEADVDLTEDDVGLAVRTALASTADFLGGDLEDMLHRARRLAVDAPALASCDALLAPLQALADGGVADEQAARVLLHRAEAGAAQLRQLIRAGEQDARLRERFARQLERALSEATMEEGKRRGGQIACPLGRADWAWVSAQYHRRWLPWTGAVWVDGVAQPLRPDQALGLYVTGRSLSGFEFDVSVHLWLRKPGCTGLPARDTAPYAPMNDDDWTDTFVPCTVLHVPSAG